MIPPKFDQHFLVDEEVLSVLKNQILNISSQKVLEIGGGKGVLTTEIIKQQPKEFTCVEIDSSMISSLKQLFDSSLYKLIKSDAIEFLKSKQKDSFDFIIGNIPYGITESLYTQLYFLLPKSVLFLQSHKTTRTLIEKQNTKQSVLINSLYNLECIKIIEGDSFEPMAKTKSSIIKLELKTETDKSLEELFLSGLTKRYNQTFYNSCVYSLGNVLEVGKKEIKAKLIEDEILISNEKIDAISNEEFNLTINKIIKSFFK